MTSIGFSPKPFRAAPIAFGAALILLGLLLLADRMAPDLARHAGPWWPLLIAIVGAGRLLDRGPFHTGGHVLIGLSLALLAASHQRMDLVDRYWPLGLIWLGLVIAGRAFRPRRSRPDSAPEGES